MNTPSSRSGGRGAAHVDKKSAQREQLEAAVAARALPPCPGETATWVVDAWTVDGRHSGYAWWRATDGHERRVMFQGAATGEELGRALLSGLALLDGGVR